MATKKIPRLLLFDIDGTLTKSSYTNGTHYFLEALSVGFNKKMEMNGTVFAGGTDQSIIHDVISRNGITDVNQPMVKECIDKTFNVLVDILEKGISAGHYKWNMLPNVSTLLQCLSERNDVKLALLTGNIKPAAKCKLQSAGINLSHFGAEDILGAFGCDHAVRSELVKIAKKRYELYLKDDVPNESIVVIGDTPKDIECAHANRVACVAVATGKYSVDDLSEADVVLKDFIDHEKAMNAIIGSKFQC